MFRDTITIFNYHTQTGLWYPSVVSCACVSENGGTNAAKNGEQNGDTVEILLQCNADNLPYFGAIFYLWRIQMAIKRK